MEQSKAFVNGHPSETSAISSESDNGGLVDLLDTEYSGRLAGKVRCASCGREFWPDGQRKKFCDHACYSVSLKVPIEQRFWTKVKGGEPDDCWLWTGATIKGYGQISGWLNGKKRPLYAHRLAWEFAHGLIPDGLEVLHQCDVPLCVNVAHLFLGTQADNLADARSKGRLLSAEVYKRRKRALHNVEPVPFVQLPVRELHELGQVSGASLEDASSAVHQSHRAGHRLHLAVVALLLLLVPRVASAQAWPIVVGSGFDLGTTLYDLHTLPGHEANPFLAHGGTVGLIAVKSGATALLVVAVNRLTHEGHPRLAQVIGWTSGVVFSGVAIRNLRVGR